MPAFNVYNFKKLICILQISKEKQRSGMGNIGKATHHHSHISFFTSIYLCIIYMYVCAYTPFWCRIFQVAHVTVPHYLFQLICLFCFLLFMVLIRTPEGKYSCHFFFQFALKDMDCIILLSPIQFVMVKRCVVCDF